MTGDPSTSLPSKPGVCGFAGVMAPVPHGVLSSSRDPSCSVGAYIPNSVDEVRFSMDRVRLGGMLPPLDLKSALEGRLASLEGVGGVEGSVEAGVIWNAR